MSTSSKVSFRVFSSSDKLERLTMLVTSLVLCDTEFAVDLAVANSVITKQKVPDNCFILAILYSSYLSYSTIFPVE